jgi:hypothetical protein
MTNNAFRQRATQELSPQGSDWESFTRMNQTVNPNQVSLALFARSRDSEPK